MSKHLAPEPSPRSRQAPKRVVRILTLIGVFFAAVIIGFGVVGAITKRNPIELIAQSFVPSPEQVFGKSNILVLLEGLDYDYTDSDVEFSTSSRSDIIKAVNLDFANHKIYVLSVPRDMLATLPNGRKRKINQAQADGGVTEARQVIAQFLGIPGFDRYAVFRIDASKKIIDAIGGIDVYVKNSDCLRYKTDCTGGRIDYDDNWGHLHVHLTEGMHHLNGPEAVAYSRFRHDWCSDPCRIMRQQQVMDAVVRQVQNNKLATAMKIGPLLDIVKNNVQSDFTQSEMISLASFFADIKKSDIVSKQVPYTSDISWVDGDDLVPDDAARARLVQNMLIAPPSPQPSPDAMALAGITPSSVRIDVENGSDIPGAAKRLADALKAQGFTIGTVGNASRLDHAHTLIREHSATAFAGAKVRSALPVPLQAATITSTSPTTGTATSDVTVIIGEDAANALPVPSRSPGA